MLDFIGAYFSFILLGIIILIVVIVKIVRGIVDSKNYTKAKTKQKSCSCGSMATTSATLEEITVRSNLYSHSPNQYNITFCFKCPNCGKEIKKVFGAYFEYYIRDDIFKRIWDIAESEFDINRIYIPQYKIKM